jgi:hypothetical protein
VIGVAVALVATGTVHACGQCLEDKIAATYDDGVSRLAARRGLVVVYTEIKGPAAGAPPELATRVRHAIEWAPGVEPGTVRVSLDPPAASFACPPGPRARAVAIAAASRRLAARRLRLVELQVGSGATSTPRGVASLARGTRAARVTP